MLHFWLALFLVFLINLNQTDATLLFDRAIFVLEPSSKSLIRVRENDRLELPCLAISNVDQIGSNQHEPLLNRWMKDYRPELRLRQSLNGSLIFRNFKKQNSGTYHCVILVRKPQGAILLSSGTKLVLIDAISSILNESKKTYTVYPGENIRLLCPYDHDDNFKLSTLQWYFNGSDLRAMKNDRFHCVSNRVYIFNLNAGDFGNYECTVSTITGDYLSQKFHIEPKISDDSSSSNNENHSLLFITENSSVVAGSRFMLECLTRKYLSNKSSTSMYWRKNGLKLNSSIVTFNRISFENEGRYECVVENGAENRTSVLGTSFINVEFAPVIIKRPEEHIAKRGMTVTFYCDVESSPPAEITWFFNGEGVKIEGRVKTYPMPFVPASQLKKDTFRRKLVISSVRSQDGGIYQCFASNRHGTVSAAAFLIPENSGPTEALANLTSSIVHEKRQVELQWQLGPKLLAERIRMFIFHFYKKEIGEVEQTESITYHQACAKFKSTQKCSALCCNVVMPLTPTSNYTFWITALTEKGQLSLPSQEILVQTWDEVAKSAMPLSIRELVEDRMVFWNLEWNENDINLDKISIITEYRLEFGKVINGYHNSVRQESRKMVYIEAGAQNYSMHNLTPNTIYQFRLIYKTRSGYPTLEKKDDRFPWTRFETSQTNHNYRSNNGEVYNIVVQTPIVSIDRVTSSTVGLSCFLKQDDYNDQNFCNVHYGMCKDPLDQWKIISFHRNVTTGVIKDMDFHDTFLCLQIWSSNNLKNNSRKSLSIAQSFKMTSDSHSIDNNKKNNDKNSLFSSASPIFTPQNLTCSKNDGEAKFEFFHIRWNEVIGARKYLVQVVKETVSMVVFETANNFLEIPSNFGLEEGMVSIQSYTPLGLSELSDFVQCSLLKNDIFAAPEDVFYVIFDNGSLLLNWEAPSNSNNSENQTKNIILSYSVKYRPLENEDDDVNENKTQIIVDGSTHSAYVHNLNMSMKYQFCVRAVDQRGISGLEKTLIIDPQDQNLHSEMAKRRSTQKFNKSIMTAGDHTVKFNIKNDSNSVGSSPSSHFVYGVIVGCSACLIFVILILLSQMGQHVQPSGRRSRHIITSCATRRRNNGFAACRYYGKKTSANSDHFDASDDATSPRQIPLLECRHNQSIDLQSIGPNEPFSPLSLQLDDEMAILSTDFDNNYPSIGYHDDDGMVSLPQPQKIDNHNQDNIETSTCSPISSFGQKQHGCHITDNNIYHSADRGIKTLSMPNLMTDSGIGFDEENQHHFRSFGAKTNIFRKNGAKKTTMQSAVGLNCCLEKAGKTEIGVTVGLEGLSFKSM